MLGRPRREGVMRLAPDRRAGRGREQKQPNPGLNIFRTLLVGGLGGVRLNALRKIL